MAGELISLTATVEAIDLEKRLVTLKGPEGNTVTLEVGEQARNLSQVKVGDQVQADYYESVALYAQKPDGSLPAAAEMAAVERAPAGEKPGIAAVDSRIITATVESIDLEKRAVALKGPEGNTLNLKLDDRTPNMENAENQRPGGSAVYPGDCNIGDRQRIKAKRKSVAGISPATDSRCAVYAGHRRSR